MTDDHELGPLLGRIRAGDEQAIGALLAQLRPYLHLLVRRQLEPGQRGALSESDVVQETLVRLHGGLDPASCGAAGHFQGHDPPAFLAWVSQIVRHVIVDLERRGLAQKRDARRDVPGSRVFATLAEGTTPEQAAERAENTVLLAAALQRLPAHQREVLEWRFFEHLSYAEISARTGKSEGALRVVVTRALDALRSDHKLRRLMGATS
jgi:RNA polymerase sigma-70 factor (ECF subfamily)